MTIAEIEKRFRKTIDQYYAYPCEEYIKAHQTEYIGGVLHAALHILPFENYYSLKVYCYTQHGYDPGGVTDGQMSLDELEGIFD